MKRPVMRFKFAESVGIDTVLRLVPGTQPRSKDGVQLRHSSKQRHQLMLTK
jgi:hypothetical protein